MLYDCIKESFLIPVLGSRNISKGKTWCLNLNYTEGWSTMGHLKIPQAQAFGKFSLLHSGAVTQSLGAETLKFIWCASLCDVTKMGEVRLSVQAFHVVMPAWVNRSHCSDIRASSAMALSLNVVWVEITEALDLYASLFKQLPHWRETNGFNNSSCLFIRTYASSIHTFLFLKDLDSIETHIYIMA